VRPAGDGRPWRADNPLPVPTERERHVIAQGLPVYRVLYRRRGPLQAAWVDAALATHNPGDPGSV